MLLQCNESLHPARDILKLAGSQRSYHGFERFDCFHTAAILASLYAVFMCAVPAVTCAQVAGGSITGTARGDSGSAMPGVRISIKDVTTGQVRTVLTDTSGSYSLPALPVGKYEMTVSALAFVSQLWTGITVTVGSRRILDILMRAGNSESVVRATVPGPPSNQSSGTADNSVGQNTPLNGRDWTQLATLQAGGTRGSNGSANGRVSNRTHVFRAIKNFGVPTHQKKKSLEE